MTALGAGDIMVEVKMDYVVEGQGHRLLKIGTRDGKRYVYWTHDGFIATLFTKDQADLMADLYSGTVRLV